MKTLQASFGKRLAKKKCHFEKCGKSLNDNDVAAQGKMLKVRGNGFQGRYQLLWLESFSSQKSVSKTILD